jgi:p-aminobenzoyl-glutamate transporter AbgT
VLGLSIEPLAQIIPQFSQIVPGTTKATAPVDPAVLVEKILKHFVNYVSGFAADGFTPAAMNIVSNWYQLVSRKVRLGGLEFLDRED